MKIGAPQHPTVVFGMAKNDVNNMLTCHPTQNGKGGETIDHGIRAISTSGFSALLVA